MPPKYPSGEQPVELMILQQVQDDLRQSRLESQNGFNRLHDRLDGIEKVAIEASTKSALQAKETEHVWDRLGECSAKLEDTVVKVDSLVTNESTRAAVDKSRKNGNGTDKTEKMGKAIISNFVNGAAFSVAGVIVAGICSIIWLYFIVPAAKNVPDPKTQNDQSHVPSTPSIPIDYRASKGDNRPTQP